MGVSGLRPGQVRRPKTDRLLTRGAMTSLAGALLLSFALAGCATMGMRSAVDMHVTIGPETPPEALVYIDGQYIGSLAAVAARGVRIVEGKHRLSVEKTGYFPYDTIVESKVEPIHLQVTLLKLPD